MPKNKQLDIRSIISQVGYMSKVSVVVDDDNNFSIQHEQQYVPDFYFSWCANKQHFRVYIHVANTNHEKKRAGYCICVIPGTLAAALFLTVYSFIHKHRANNKELMD